MGVKINGEIIYQKLKSRFPNYLFDMSSYTNTHCKIPVICDKGHKSNQLVKNLLSGHGCNICGTDRSSEKQKSNFSEVLKKFKNKHGNKYDYSEFEYKNNRTDSTIICPEHGPFKQSSYTHIKGHGCPSCSKNRKLTTQSFISKSKELHNNKYDYTKVDYKNMKTPVIIICPKHGEFLQVPMTHIGQISGCPKCNESLGERLIANFLDKNEIKYVSQKKFDGCVNKSSLIFDFFLPDYNCCIEFNGIQHYYPVNIFGGDESFKITKLRDKIKYDFCAENNILLIVIKQDRKHIDISDVNLQINNILNILNKNESVLKFTEFIKPLLF